MARKKFKILFVMKEFEVRNPPLIPPLIGGNLLPWQNMRLKGDALRTTNLRFIRASSPFEHE